MALSDELRHWHQGQRCLKAVASLEHNGLTAVYCETAQQARDYILAEAVDARTVGFGGSLSVADLDLADVLRQQGRELLNHSAPGLSREERYEIMRRQLTCDLFLCGTNALTLDGCLVNIDATGNRAASMFFGPRKVIVVAGRNKIVDGGVAEAMARVKQWASPPNAKRLGFNTPCAVSGFCSDCRSPDRICRVTTIIDRKPRMTDLRVLVVNEELGL